MGKRNVSEIETGAGFFMGLSTGLMDVVREKVVPFGAIYRLATPDGRTTLSRMVDLAHADWMEEQSKPLPPNHYRVHVNRGPLPPMAILEKQFSKRGVSGDFDGECEWKKHPSRTGKNDVTAEEVVMVVKQFTSAEIREMGGLGSHRIIAWGLKNGLVPADEKETYSFGINPETCEFQGEFWLVGLGSVMVSGDGDFVAILHDDDHGRRLLNSYWFGNDWSPTTRFLFVVRKVAPVPLVTRP